MAKMKIYQAANRFTVKDLMFLLTGIFSFCVGLQGFLLPNHFLDGGVVGIALIVQKITGMNFVILLLLLNLPFMWLGRSSVSPMFAAKAASTIIVLGVVLWFFKIPAMTSDPVLVSVFGGFFIGAGVGLTIRGGAVLDGTEVLALYLGKRSSLTVGDYILMMNIAIFASAIFVFNLETALYAMLTYLCASRTVDFVVYGIEEYMAIQIFSERSALIYKVLQHEMKLNLHVMNGQRGAPQSRHEKANHVAILHVVVTRLEVARILNTVKALDPEATIVYHPVTDMHHLTTSERLSLAEQHNSEALNSDPV